MTLQIKWQTLSFVSSYIHVPRLVLFHLKYFFPSFFPFLDYNCLSTEKDGIEMVLRLGEWSDFWAPTQTVFRVPAGREGKGWLQLRVHIPWERKTHTKLSRVAKWIELCQRHCYQVPWELSYSFPNAPSLPSLQEGRLWEDGWVEGGHGPISVWAYFSGVPRGEKGLCYWNFPMAWPALNELLWTPDIMLWLCGF